jgi:putative membrane protein
MKTRVSVLLAVAVVLAGIGSAASAKSAMSPAGHSDTASNAMDKTFTTMAAMGGTAEITLSKIAAMRTSDPKVKKFALMMVHDHTVMGHGLAVTAASNNLPAPMKMDAAHTALAMKLSHMSGKALDSAYLAAMIDDHAKTASLFQNEIAHGENIHVTNLATKNVGTVQNHLQMAQNMTGTQNKPSKIKNPKTNSTSM